MAWVLVGLAPGLLERSCCLVGLGALSGDGGGSGKANKSGEGAARGGPRCGPVCGLRAGDSAGESPSHGQRGAVRVSSKGFPASGQEGRTLSCRRVSGGAEAPGAGCLSLGTLGLALGSPIFPSGCEGKLGVALESLQGLRDLT